jgi:hypothetical protein
MPTTDAGATGDCTGDIVCDDFESNALGAHPATWGVPIDGVGTVAVDNTHAFSGNKAVRIVVTPSSGQATVQISKNLSLPKNDFFGRMMVRFNPFTYSNHHWTLILASGHMPGSTTDQGWYQYGGVETNSILEAAYLSPHCDCGQRSTVPLPVSRWMCVEWHFDGIHNGMEFWLDGAAINALTIPAGTWLAPAFERLYLGWGYGAALGTPDVEMWIDDVGIDSTRIGCPTATASTH